MVSFCSAVTYLDSLNSLGRSSAREPLRLISDYAIFSYAGGWEILF